MLCIEPAVKTENLDVVCHETYQLHSWLQVLGGDGNQVTKGKQKTKEVWLISMTHPLLAKFDIN